MIEYLDEGITTPEQKILYWRENPIEAARDIFGCTTDDPDDEFDLDWHQRIVLNSRWKHSTEYDILSRGCGKTFLNAVTPALRSMLYAGNRCGLIGPSFRQSKMIMDEVKRLWYKSPVFQQSAPDGVKVATDKAYVEFTPAVGKNPSYIEALPLGVDGGKSRGARFYEVYADEIAQIDNEILNVVVRGYLATSMEPMKKIKQMRRLQEQFDRGEISADQLNIMSSNKFFGSSTAFYQYNHLWERISNIMKQIMDPVKAYQIEHRCDEKTAADALGYKLMGGPLNDGQIPYRVMSNGRLALLAFTYLDPSKGFINMDSVNEAMLEMSDYMFRMEYCAFFPPDSEGFFRRTMLNKAREHNEFACQLGPRKGMQYVMGVDPARNNDNFSIAIFEVDNNRGLVNLVRVISWNKKNFVEMHNNIRQIIKHYNIEYFEMDAGGGGTTIRDLLASPVNCPAGQQLILERDLDEHRALHGDRILGKLIQFSSADWVHDANHNLLSGLQHGKLFIAAKPGFVEGGSVWTGDLDDADEEIEAALSEMSTIVVTQAGSRMRWDTPQKKQRKDRYSAILVGYNAALKILTNGVKKELAFGGWY